ncbi:MAG: hypothetical protein QM323_02795 [Acidobacteriota bacterium]|nr:hypothetical protein [Acidobacteriota bacterium]
MAVATVVPLVMTSQTPVSVAGAAALIIPPLAGARVVLVSLVLGATAGDTIQIYEGTVAVPGETLKIGALPVGTAAPTGIQCAHAADCLIRTAVSKGVAIDVTGGATVTGMASFYYEGAP